MGYVSKVMPPYAVRDWCAQMRKYGHFRIDAEIAHFTGLTESQLASIKYQGAGAGTRDKCIAALGRVRPAEAETKPEPKPEPKVSEVPEVDPRGPHGEVMRLIMLHRSLPVNERTLGRAATAEERAAFLRRQKRGS